MKVKASDELFNMFMEEFNILIQKAESDIDEMTKLLKIKLTNNNDFEKAVDLIKRLKKEKLCQ